ncbi:MAG: DUF3127 domain-containing protein [Bacteroidales bacterium]|nr:DUF3127 domain-containing protein [Bacteroidales bacterium]
MEITGKLIQLLPEVSGESARGPWVRGGFVIETDGDYPRKVAFTAFGEERVAMAKNIPMGSPVQVTFTPESREFNEKWYTDLRASRIQPFVPGQMPAAGGYAWQGAAPVAGAQPAAAPTQPAAPAAAAAPAANFAAAPQMASNPDDDLPF